MAAEWCPVTGKEKHQSRRKAAMQMKRRGATRHAGSYLCEHCNGWHIGHTPKLHISRKRIWQIENPEGLSRNGDEFSAS